MVFILLKIGLIAAFLYYIVWERIIRLYYIYWYYRRQGIPSVGFPFPVVGNLPLFLKSLYGMTAKSKTPLEDYFTAVFGPGKLPPLFLDMRHPKGILVVTGPQYVDELYIGKNKYFDKDEKERRVYYGWFGDSIFHAKSDHIWLEQRKHLAAAFYKEKMNLMLKIMIGVTNQRVQKWLKDYGTGLERPDVSMTLEFSDLIADSDLAAVFGVRSI